MKINAYQSNFTAGEISPNLYGRVDIDRYRNALKKSENVFIGIYGGAKRRPGWRYVAEVSDSTKATRLVPWIISNSEAYLVEMAKGKALRFYGAGALIGNTVNLTAVFNPDPFLVRYAQDEGALYLTVQPVPPDVAVISDAFGPMVLENIATSLFSGGGLPFTLAPSAERTELLSTGVTLSATTGVITATAGATSFQLADVGRYFRAGAGYAKITGWTSTTVITVNTGLAGGRDFDTTVYNFDEASVETSPQATVTPSVTGPIAAAITLTAGIATWKNLVAISHIGDLVEINGGLAEITGFTSTTIVTGIVRSLLSSVTAAGAGAWVLRGTISTNLAAIGFHEQRMLLANAAWHYYGGPSASGGYLYYETQTLWGSVIGDVTDFSLGSADDDAYQFSAKSDTSTPIEHIVSLGRAVLIFSGSAVISMVGGTEKAITPANPPIMKVESEYGSNGVRPVRTGDEILYVQSNGKRILAAAYKTEVDGYPSTDISLLAEHLLADGVTDLAYARDDGKLVLAVAGGDLVASTFDREQNVDAWTRQVTDGVVESVAVIPYNDTSQIWAVIKRTIGGVDKRYVERMEEGRNADSCITGTAGAPTTAWSGLTHLEGKAVDIIADGAYVGQKTVSGGAVTLDVAASAVEIGLHYNSKATLFPVSIPTQTGVSEGDAISVHEIIVKVKDTVGMTINGRPVDFRRLTHSTDTAIPPFSGNITFGALGWKTSGEELVLEQTQPLPWHVLSVVRKVSINQG